MRFFRLFALFACIIFLAPSPALAVHVTEYDLDSLCYLSDSIVEATVLKPSDNGDIEIEIAKVYFGKLTAGQKIVLQNSNSIFKECIGTRIFLCLDGESSPKILPNGIRMIKDGRVQLTGRIAMFHPEETGEDGKPLTPDAFRTQLEERIKTIAELKRRFSAELSVKDAPWLLDVLKARVKLRTKNWDLDDSIASLAENRLVRLRSPEIAEAATDIIGHASLSMAVCSPDGREYLLKRVADESLPLKRRVLLAGLIRESHRNYNLTFALDTKNRWLGTGFPIEGNGRYLTRIAQLAANNRNQPELCHALINAVDKLANGIPKYEDKKILSDGEAALAILKSIYDGTADQELQYLIELATLHFSEELYASMKSKCGPILAIVQMPSKEWAAPPGYFPIVYDFATLEHEVLNSPSVIFLNKDTQQKFTSPFDMPGKDPFTSQQGGGGHPILLPKEMPSGTYQIYLEFTLNGKVVSESHYFETKIDK